MPSYKHIHDSPHGITKPEWSSVPPFTRSVDFTPLICLDALHSSMLPIHPPPSFLTISAASDITLANEVIRYAQVLASTHQIPAIVCSLGASAAIDLTGRIKHQQEGGKGFVVDFAIPWLGEGAYRTQTWAEYLGPMGVLAGATIVVALFKAGEVWWIRGEEGLIGGVRGGMRRIGQGGQSIAGLLDWRSDPDYFTDDEGIETVRWYASLPLIPNLMDDLGN